MDWFAHRKAKSSLLRHLEIFRRLGILPFKLDPPSSSAVCKLTLFKTFVIIISNACFQCIGSRPYYRGKISRFIGILTHQIYLVLPIGLTYCMIRYRRVFDWTVNSLIAVQSKIQIERYELFNSIKCTSLSYIVLVCTSFSLRLLILKNDFSEFSAVFRDIMEILLWLLFYLYLYLNVFYFTYMIESLGLCFSELSSFSFTRQSKAATNKAINTFIRIHDNLINIGIQLNEYFALVIASTLLCNFMNFLTYFSLFLPTFGNFPFSDAERLVWILLMVLLTSHMIRSCHRVVNKAEECNRALLSYIINDKSEAYANNPLVVIHLCSRKTLTFTACKCVNVDYRLGLSMVAAFLTYIVVLFQIESTNGPTPTDASPTATNISNFSIIK